MTRLCHSTFVASARNLALTLNRSRVRLGMHSFCSHPGAVVGRNFGRALSVALIISLLTTSTPAASQTIVGVSREWRVSVAFWLHASGLLAKLNQGLTGSKPRPQERQEDRDGRIRRIRISPDQVTARIGETVRFAALAYDDSGDAIGGVRFTWSAQGAKEDVGELISSTGEFTSEVDGNFRISVEGAGQRAQTEVTVLAGAPIPKAQRAKVKDLSTRDQSSAEPQSERGETEPRPNARASRNPRSIFRKTSFRSAEPNTTTSPASPVPQGADQYGWNSDNYTTADDPGGQTGDPPGSPMDDGAGNGNFQITAPVVSLPGRGINVSLGLAYNAHLWHKAGNNITYDIDRGWPAPGWSLGFGKIEDIGNGGSIIIEADGTRHGFNGSVFGSTDSFFSGQTTDGSLINYQCTRSGGVIIVAFASLPNGTNVLYGAPGDGAVYPTQIVDANGNFVTVTYRNNAGPQIDTVTDTMGRVVSFQYDPNGLLTAVTAPGLNGGGPRTLVRLHYQQQSVDATFTSLTRLVRNPSPWLLDAIYYPGTGTGYWFGESNSFLPSYGMLANVIEQRGMTLSSGSLNDMGTITPGTMTKQAVYNWQTSTNNAPTYTSRTETWAGMDSGPAVTTYLVNENASPRTSTVTLPNGVKSIQYSINAPGQFNDGLIFKDETYDSDGTTLLSRSEVSWALGDYSSPRPTLTSVTTRQGSIYVTTGTEFSYAPSPSFNQVTEVRNYDYGYVPGGSNTMLRKTVTEYENSAHYNNRHIFNLPKIVSVFAGDGFTRVSRTEYTYDGGTLQDTPGVVQHSDQSNPYAPVFTIPGHWETHCTGCPPCSCVNVWIPPRTASAYNPETNYRGNVTQVKTFADAATLNESTAVVETRNYDINGNMVKASTSCCQQTSFNFTAATKYTYPESQTRGSATDPYAQVTTSVTYDFNTGLTLSATDANGRISQTSYSPETLRPDSLSLPTLAHTDFAYDDIAMSVTETTFLEAHPTHTTIADQNVKLLNGHGQVRQERGLGANTVWDLIDTVYDNMGRISQQSRPYRDGDTPFFTSVAYDTLGRTTRITEADGSVTETYYNEIDFDPNDGYSPTRPDVSASVPGERTLVRDAWGRERWGRTDAQGRLVEVVEPNALGSGSVSSGGLLTTYSYNSLGNLTGIVQGAQTRAFKFDSLGRLTQQKLAESSATLNDAGVYQTSGGTWSDVFTYDDRSNLTSRTDARGVKAVYSYNGDPLNRLQSVSWDTSGFGDTANPILPAATVSYQYRSKSSGSQLLDIAQVSTITTSGVSSENYVYDSEGRVSSTTMTLTSRQSFPFTTDYIFDALDGITDVRYPAEYGNGTQPRKLVHKNYDVASRLTSMTVDGAIHASQIVYNAASQTSSLKVGANGANQITENYAYNGQTGLLDNQNLTRGATTLLNLSYDYTNVSGKRTGQLTKILNNLNHNKDRGYTYDALGRLKEATGGSASAPLWTQSYSYDRYGNRTGVSANGFSAKLDKRGTSPNLTESLIENPTAAGSLLGVVGTSGSSAAIAPPTDPQISLPAEQLAARTGVDAPESRRTEAPRSTSNSHHASRSTPPSAATPQGSPPPVFTDPDLLAAGGIQLKALHITELRTAINALRGRLGLAAYSWQTSASPGGLIKADPIVEMRTALDQALGAPSPGYSSGLAQGLPVLAIHIQELRNRVVGAWSSSSAIPSDGLGSVSYDVTSNRITTAGFDYDRAGNQVRALVSGGGSQRFQYDAANRLVKVKADDNQTVIVTYTYGDSNERLIADAAGLRTYYACDGSSEYSESGNSTSPQWSKSYIYLGARLLSTLTANGSGGEFVEYHHPDHLGTRLVTNAQDTTYFEQVTLPFGTALHAESTGSTNRRFTSYDRSTATGLDYADNRHYDSQQGRFTQVDPIGMDSVSLGSPQTLNLYAYCTNDPINHADPSGLGFFSKLFKWIGRALKILSIVALVVMTAIVFAPASSFAFKAALWMFFHVLLPLSQIPVLGAFVPLGTFGSPPWNPQSRGLFGNSFQGQGSNCPPDCQEQITLPPVSAGTIYANYSIWERAWRAVDIGLDKGLTSVVGFADWITLGGSKLASRKFATILGGEGAGRSWDQDNTEREGSWFHTAGQAAGVAWDIATGAEFAKAYGWGMRFLRYPNAGGGGINLYRFGVRRFALDWHTIKSLGPGKVLHWHWGLTKKAMKLHRGFWTGRIL